MATGQLLERTLGATIAEAMDAKGYSSRELGDLLGVSKTTVNFWRQGKHPESHRLDAIAKELDLDGDVLWTLYRKEVRARQGFQSARSEKRWSIG